MYQLAESVNKLPPTLRASLEPCQWGDLICPSTGKHFKCTRNRHIILQGSRRVPNCLETPKTAMYKLNVTSTQQ